VGPIIAVAAILGAVVGSFLNVVIHRLPRGESLVSPRSRCPGCGTPIAPRDNVPLLSWLALRGRCRHCRASISPRYPLVELLTAAVFAVVVAVRGPAPELLLDLPFAAALIAIGGIDLNHRIVPNRIVVPAALWGLLAGALVRLDRMPELLLAGAIAFVLMLLAALAYPAGMGLGDVKLAGVMGLFLGVAVAPALFAAFAAGSLLGLALIARHGQKGRKMALPFAPFLAAGGILGLVAGPELLDLYVRSFAG
jgi:leader peptidase (prepilin peptidase)/N-methyltransferase